MRNMAKLLVVDDESNIRDIIKKYATFEGYEVVEASDGMDAIIKARNKVFDLIVMDVMMPELDGFSSAKEILKEQNVPIILLSARGEEYDRIHGFEIGIDDYVVKPFSPKELMMRIAAILKRAKQVDKDKDMFVYNTLEVNFTSRTVSINGQRIEMSPKEYDLFFYMVKNKDIALTREQLISDVWGYDFYGDDRTLDTHIKLLRKRLLEYSTTIVTLRGVGYRFETNI